jgi:hypothetical protein
MAVETILTAHITNLLPSNTVVIRDEKFTLHSCKVQVASEFTWVAHSIPSCKKVGVWEELRASLGRRAYQSK